MKLTCPNCQAQYEIPDGAIPDAGRDVQCSSCDETWFQDNPNKRPESAEQKTEPVPPQPDPVIAAPPIPAPSRRDLPAAVSDILRQEAEREKTARAGLPSRTAADRSTRRPGAVTAQGATDHSGENMRTPSTTTGPRQGRSLLPDIDENRHRLTSRSLGIDLGEPDDEIGVDTSIPERKNGFMRGFALMILLFGIALAVYVFAPQLAENFPALYEPLSSYVDAVNSGRLWLNDLLSGLKG